MKKTLRIIALSLVMVTMLALLASCGDGPNADPEKAIAALKENGYTAEGLSSDDLKNIVDLEDATVLKAGVTGFKMSLTEGSMDAIIILYFDSKSAAKDAFSKVKEAMDATLGEVEIDFTVKQSGKMIWAGTDAAIKAAK